MSQSSERNETLDLSTGRTSSDQTDQLWRTCWYPSLAQCCWSQSPAAVSHRTVRWLLYSTGGVTSQSLHRLPSSHTVAGGITWFHASSWSASRVAASQTSGGTLYSVQLWSRYLCVAGLRRTAASLGLLQPVGRSGLGPTYFIYLLS